MIEDPPSKNKKAAALNSNNLIRRSQPVLPVFRLEQFKSFTDLVRRFDEAITSYLEFKQRVYMIDITDDDTEQEAAELHAEFATIVGEIEDIAIVGEAGRSYFDHAEHQDIVDRLAFMIGAFSNFTPHSPAAFNLMFVAHVSDLAPRRMVLETACRRFETEAKFVSINEFLVVLSSENKRWNRRMDIHVESRNIVGLARKAIEDRKLYQQRKLAHELRQAQKAAELKAKREAEQKCTVVGTRNF